MESQTLCVHIFVYGMEKTWTNSLFEKKNLSTNKSPPPAPHPTLSDRDRSMGMPRRRKAQKGCDPG